MVEATKEKSYPMYYLALCLIVLIQLSSCSVERVFSRLKHIRDAIGDNMLESDISEIRLFLQCNGDLESIDTSLRAEKNRF